MQNRHRVLVVDDDRQFCRILGTIAERNDVDVVTVHDGGEVQQALSQHGPFNIIFLDLNMPDVCGWEVLDRVRRDRATVNTPVVIVSGEPVSHEERVSLCDDSTQFISKATLTLERLESMMREVLAEDGQRT